MGSLAQNPAFARRGDESLCFTVVFDGTGAIPSASPTEPVPRVADQIKALLKVLDDHSGGQAEPSYVKIQWGSLAFRGRLESLNTQYTLFTPAGFPLRAKVELVFLAFVGQKASAVQANANRSTSQEQVRVVKAGDTLPQLCESVYGDPSYCAKVADHNGLSSFRSVPSGTKLRLPPLRP